MAAPVVILVSGLYKLPVIALDGLFRLIPPGHMLPATDTTEIAIHAVGTTFSLALQLASPFVVIAMVWHVAMGQIARVASRMQIYFVSVPGQIMTGLAFFAICGSAISLSWRGEVETFFSALPGGG
jgi:flagellar biosynthetic protein FliR